MIRLALFDCDGTLVDSAANIVLAMTRAFTAHGLTPPAGPAVRGIVGLSLPQAMAALHPDADPAFHLALAESYKAAFVTMRGTPDFAHEPLYPGIADVVATLDDAGWLLGVVTGKSDRGLRLILEQHGLKHRFVTLQTADRHPSKPDPAMALAAMAEAGASPAETVVIGDTAFDMALARRAGARGIGVGWGYHAPADLIAAGAERVVGSADELLACLADAPTSRA